MDWNIFITKTVTDYNKSQLGEKTQNSAYSTTSATHYKEKLFSDGEFLHVTIKDAAQYIYCNIIKPKNIIHIKCALGFCDECPEYNIPYK